MNDHFMHSEFDKYFIKDCISLPSSHKWKRKLPPVAL